jgi:four helix bundle protein
MANPPIERFEDIVGQKARELTKMIYQISEIRPFFTDFALRNQIRKASLSVMSNIAEGYDRNRNPEFLYFLRVAKASCGEVRSQVYVAMDVGHIDKDISMSLLDATTEVARLIRRLQDSIKRKMNGTQHSALGTEECS